MAANPSYLNADIFRDSPTFDSSASNQRALQASRNSFVPALTTQRSFKTILNKPVLFQILFIDNIKQSKFNQIDNWLEFQNPLAVSTDKLRNSKKGSGANRNNRIIKSVDLSNDNDTDSNSLTDTSSLNAIYKLTLQDSQGNLCYAFELENLDFLHSSDRSSIANALLNPLPVPLGSKIIVYNCLVLEGTLMLNNKGTEYLGGQLLVLNDNISSKVIKNFKAMLELLSTAN
ncbi:Rmi1p ASCRUDRAFT_6689 [Ascoidea rubescens DSM 1968]|uniref:RecQ mediated genome instability protein 1 OB-fold domain-containing protein n=1 Tax=Ascoidea rubescens DSM 1968 TaxID=1344418 RepID=A0A1D2VNB2_9ASCO|nr:hypothetical protein ASCRUDRAFT_6689 [Ascoidea rubescens DSM 1968]ODV63111.1 hypothetical protein ASCRUDRAFT_6689 [Ascoidea rubescens DSM 1968]